MAVPTANSISHELLKWLVGLVLLLTSATFGYTLRTESRLTMLEITVSTVTTNNERRVSAIEANQATNARLTNEKLDRISDNVSLIQGALHLKAAN